MAQQKTGQDVTAGAGRRDEVGKTGIYPATGPYPDGELNIRTPAEINKGQERKEENEALEEIPGNDALGG